MMLQYLDDDNGLLLEVGADSKVTRSSVTLWHDDKAVHTDTIRLHTKRARTNFLANLPTALAPLTDAIERLLVEAGIAVERKRDARPGTAKAEPEEATGSAFTLEPWPEAVDGSQLLDELVGTIRRFVILTERQAVAVALWICATFVANASVATRLAIESPTKRCGKTRLLEVLQALVRHPRAAANISPAALFRTIDRSQPTVLVDEGDTFLQNNPELRGLLNAGHTRATAIVTRCEGDSFEPKDFCVFAFVALAMIGKLPDTLSDRSIRIQMRRKMPKEDVERWRITRHPTELVPLRRRVLRWIGDNNQQLEDPDPDLPDQLGDRDQDNWRLPISIADLAGEEWGDRARQTAIDLCGTPKDDTDHHGVLLLHDIRDLFDAEDKDRLETTVIVQHLGGMDERPWPAMGRQGKPLTGQKLAALLRPFEIRPAPKWKADKQTLRGYIRSHFCEAWGRYCPTPPDQVATSATALIDSDLQDNRSATSSDQVADLLSHKSIQDNAVAEVADRLPPQRVETVESDDIAARIDAIIGAVERGAA